MRLYSLLSADSFGVHIHAEKFIFRRVSVHFRNHSLLFSTGFRDHCGDCRVRGEQKQTKITGNLSIFIEQGPGATLTDSTLSFELNLHAGCIETDIGPVPIEEYELYVERYPDDWLDLIRDQRYFYGASLEEAIAIYSYDVESPKKYDPTTERKSVEIGGAFRVILRAKSADKKYGVDYYPPYLLCHPASWWIDE